MGNETHLRVSSPLDGRIVCELPYDRGEHLSERVDRSRSAFEAWRQVPLTDRIRVVERALERIREHGERIAQEVSLQMGKPIRQSRAELDTLCDRARHMVSIAPETLHPELLPRKEGFHRRIEHVPHGVVFDIAAWNYPLIIAVNVVVPAVLAGNSVLLKHSARTPLCGKVFEDAFSDAPIPDLVQNLILDHVHAEELVRDPRIDHVAFTGSVEGGRSVHRAAAGRFIEVGLELGGKDPAYVAEDADLEFSVENIVDGACYNAGQSCCAVERVYVHRSLYDEFLEKARSVLEAYRLGDPLDDSTTMGPLASAAAPEFLESQVRDALARGARRLLGGERSRDLGGSFFLPTLLADVPNDAAVMQEESFGPILPVLAVDDDEEAIARMNDTRFGLTASVWTQDRARAEAFAARLDAGTIYQNRCDYLDPALAWTGFRESGVGVSLSRWGLLRLTRRKSIHFRNLR